MYKEPTGPALAQGSPEKKQEEFANLFARHEDLVREAELLRCEQTARELSEEEQQKLSLFDTRLSKVGRDNREFRIFFETCLERTRVQIALGYEVKRLEPEFANVRHSLEENKRHRSDTWGVDNFGYVSREDGRVRALDRLWGYLYNATGANNTGPGVSWDARKIHYSAPDAQKATDVIRVYIEEAGKENPDINRIDEALVSFLRSGLQDFLDDQERRDDRFLEHQEIAHLREQVENVQTAKLGKAGGQLLNLIAEAEKIRSLKRPVSRDVMSPVWHDLNTAGEIVE